MMSPKPRNRAGMDAEAVARLMAAQDEADTAAVETPSAPVSNLPSTALDQASMASRDLGFDPGKIDGRTLRRTGREPFATRIKPETQADLKRIAYARNITIAEALELAVAAFTQLQS